MHGTFMKFYKHLLFCSLLCLASSCDMIDYHPYDTDVSGETDVNAHNIEKIEANCLNKDTLRFITMGDSQRWYDETEDFVNLINKRTDIDFVIHGGDMSDFALTDEFEIQRDLMNKLNVPYVALIGNHDCVATGSYTYEAIFGDENFSFIAGRVKFVCLDTNSMEYDFDGTAPDLDYMRSQLTDRAGEYDKTVVCMHIRPYCEEFDNTLAEEFHSIVASYTGIQFCTSAHEHRLHEEDLFGDGIMYYISDCMANRSYYLFTLTPDGYEREVVYF